MSVFCYFVPAQQLYQTDTRTENSVRLDSKPNRCELQNLVRGWQMSESHFNQPAHLLSSPHAPPNSNRHTANTATSCFFLPPPPAPSPIMREIKVHTADQHFVTTVNVQLQRWPKKHEFRTLRQYSYCGLKTRQFTTATQSEITQAWFTIAELQYCHSL